MNSKNSHLKILLVEDDLVTRKIFENTLNRQPKVVWHSVATMQDALRVFQSFQPDIVVLDIQLPDGSGMDLVQPFRQGSGCGLIMMSSLEQTAYKVNSLNDGADVYLQKPVNPAYFLATIYALNKRLHPASSNASNPATSNSQSHHWSLHHDHWQLNTPSGQIIDLTYNEYRILQALFECQPHTIDYELAAQRLGRENCQGNENALRVLLSRLRKKIQQQTRDEFTLKTVRRQIRLTFKQTNVTGP